MSTYYISAHPDLTSAEFNLHYRFQIEDILDAEDNPLFLIGDSSNADLVLQTFLAKHIAQVTVYHVGETPLHNVGNFKTRGSYPSENYRNVVMTNLSQFDVTWCRSSDPNSEPMLNMIHRERKNNLQLSDFRTILDELPGTGLLWIKMALIQTGSIEKAIEVLKSE